jgi:hypothetical protein
VTLWLSKKLVLAVEQSLSRGTGPVGSSDLGKLSKALGARGMALEEVNAEEGQQRFAAIVVENIAERKDWAEELRRLRALLKPSGRLVSVDKGAGTEVSRRFLCAGLTDLSQAEVGRHVLTSGAAL